MNIGYFRRASLYYVYQFSANRVSRSVKTVRTSLFAKVVSCINLQLPIEIWKKNDDLRHASSYNVA